jgi:hypothetical protein
MKIVNNIFLVVLATMLFAQVNCKRGNEMNTVSHHHETDIITGTHTHTEHGIETNESKTESESPKETSIKKEKYKVMFLTYKPRKVKDTLEQIPTHGKKKQRQN